MVIFLSSKEFDEVWFVDSDTALGTIGRKAVTPYPTTDGGLSHLRESCRLGHRHQIDGHRGGCDWWRGSGSRLARGDSHFSFHLDDVLPPSTSAPRHRQTPVALWRSTPGQSPQQHDGGIGASRLCRWEARR